MQNDLIDHNQALNKKEKEKLLSEALPKAKEIIRIYDELQESKIKEELNSKIDICKKVIEKYESLKNGIDSIESFIYGEEEKDDNKTEEDGEEEIQTKKDFNSIKDEINNAYQIALNIKEKEVQFSKFNTEKQNEINQAKQEFEKLKEELAEYKNIVVGGSLFRSFKERFDKSSTNQGIYSFVSILLLIALPIFIVVAKNYDVKESFIFAGCFAISFASYLASSQSKIFRKLAEEYSHKATLLESFIGYRQHHKDLLDEEEKERLFKAIINTMIRNPSKQVDKFLQFKWPWEKAVDGAEKLASSATKAVVDNVKSAANSSNENK